MKVTKKEIQSIYNVIHDYGIVESGTFPTLDQIVIASKEDRLEFADHETNGYLHIKGENKCEIYFEVD